MGVKSIIIPVTSKVREYLHNNVDDSNINPCNYNEILDFYYDIAEKNNKSLVWIYQSMVLAGLGDYVDFESDIYQASLMAYVDVLALIYNNKFDYLPFYEETCVLEGSLYDDMLFMDGERLT